MKVYKSQLLLRRFSTMVWRTINYYFNLLALQWLDVNKGELRFSTQFTREGCITDQIDLPSLSWNKKIANRKS